jgi:cell division protein ZapA
VLAALNLAYRLADRPAPPPAKKATAPSSQNSAADDVQIDTLIARIDAAMGSDGLLL